MKRKVIIRLVIFIIVAVLAVVCLLPLIYYLGFFVFIYIGLSQAGKDEYKVSTNHSSVVFDFEHLWDMQFPEEFSPVFVYYARGGWMGEGAFSAIYECEQPNEEFLINFSEDMNEEVKAQMSGFNYYYENREQLEEKYKITITLESNYLPNFNEQFISVAYHQGTKDTLYIGKDNCEKYCDEHLYMSYFPERKLLYIHEDIT